MADANVDILIRKVNQLVVEHTGGVSFAPPEIDAGHRRLLEPLADNLDVPAKLAPSVDAVLNHRYGRAYDRRGDIRVGLTELVALCANSLEPSEPTPAGPADRSRLAIAVSKAYATFATPQLAPRLFANGRADDLGRFPLPVLEGDVAAARAMAVAIGARTGSGEGDVLTALVADGHGGAAAAGARLLLKATMGYSRLPEPEQQTLVRRVGAGLESGFVARDLRAAAERELTEVLENRREDVAGGAGTVDAVSTMAAREIQELHDSLDQRPDWHSTDQVRRAAPPAEVAESMPEVYGAAHREATAADRAQAENPLRFAPGHDPATTTPRTTTAPANAPTAIQSGASLQTEPRDRNR